MNKDKFIKAVDEIHASEELKRKAKNTKSTKSAHSPRIYRLTSVMATAVIVCTVIFSASIPKINDYLANKQGADYTKELKQELPLVGTLANLKTILGQSTNTYEKSSMAQEDEFATDSASMLDAINGTTSADTLSSSNAVQDINAEDYSKTNTQVAGVDEADIVKTDGNYIYYVSGGKIEIIDVRDNKNMKIVSEIKNDEQVYFNELYINNNKLVAIGYNSVYMDVLRSAVDMIAPTNQTVIIKIYDISDKSNPKEIRTIEQEGNYLSSRMIGDNVYVVSNQNLYYKLSDNNTDIRPVYKDSVIGDSECKIDYTDISYIPNSTSENYMFIFGFNINNNMAVNVQTVLGSGQNIYVSQNNLYIAVTKYANQTGGMPVGISMPVGSTDYLEKTEIYKYKLYDAKAEYVAMGKVNGAILNQFSMDEYNGNLRIATTIDGWTQSGIQPNKNNVYVLDGNLNQLGSLENLAKGEQIYSVRFMGDRGYIVTYKQTDPLFVIDLANPTAPKVLGELKIPGFSQYLQPYDETHLIGFGQDTKQTNYGYGEVTVTNGIKISLFDVSDVANPKEVSSVKLGAYTYSDLSYNYKALLFSKEKDIFAFSITDYSNSQPSNAFMVYSVDLEKGLILKGKVVHSSGKQYDSNKEIQRGLYIGDTLFTLSPALVKATDLNTMKEISELTIEAGN
ncbi:MAG: beta-propeller domain-containing protein [Oscillospiraceae bacterium]|nr:beta-propeller domain-containing protein [Oscillospiraceae bacterium]